MPKIPGINESTRLQQGSPVEAVSVGEAGAQGRATQQLGEQIGVFAQKYAAYSQVRDNDNKALFMQEWKNKALKAGQESERFVRMNPKAAPDGSSVQPDFDSSYGNIYGEINRLKDPEQKRAAKSIADGVASKYKQGLLDYEIGKYNKFSEESIQKASDDMTFIIGNDPSKHDEVLQDFENSINAQANLSPDMKAKLIPTARKQAASAALNAYANGKNYNEARAALKSEKIGLQFNEQERQKWREEIDQREISAANRAFDKEDINRKRKKLAVEEQREGALTEVMSRMFDAQNAEERELTLEAAESYVKKGVLKKTDYDALNSMDREVDKKLDQETEFKYVDKMHTGEVQGIHNQIIKDVANGNLSHPTAGRLLKQLEQRKTGKGANSKEFNARLKNAEGFLKAQYAGNQRNIFGALIVSPDAQFDYFTAQKEFSDLVYKKGMDPEEAVKKIIGTRDPRALQGTVPGIPLEFQKTPEGLHKYIDMRKKNPPKNKAEWEEYSNQLKLLKQRFDVLAQEKAKKEMIKEGSK